VSEAKDPAMDAGVGSATDFATDTSSKITPAKYAKHLATTAMKKIKSDLSVK
jgi:hypothetical protein